MLLCTYIRYFSSSFDLNLHPINKSWYYSIPTFSVTLFYFVHFSTLCVSYFIVSSQLVMVRLPLSFNVTLFFFHLVAGCWTKQQQENLCPRLSPYFTSLIHKFILGTGLKPLNAQYMSSFVVFTVVSASYNNTKDDMKTSSAVYINTEMVVAFNSSLLNPERYKYVDRPTGWKTTSQQQKIFMLFSVAKHKMWK